MRLTIDASVAVKWLVVEDRHELARDVLRDEFVLTAPDLLLIEVANALRTKVRAKILDTAQAKSAIDVLPRYFDRLVRPSEVLAVAFDIACRINHPVADCVYVACAQATGGPLLTDDETLYKKAKGIGADIRIEFLAHWKLGPPMRPGA